NKKLDVVVGTHQHNDHVSGFVHCENQFKDIIDQVWLSWLDDPDNKLAQQIKIDQKNLVSQLKLIDTKLRALNKTNEILSDMLGFFGVSGNDPEIPAKGIEILKKIGKKKPDYLKPGQQIDLPGLPAGEVKVYVLGPPPNKTMLFDKDPKKTETYDPAFAIAQVNTARMLSALDNYNGEGDIRLEEQFPFNKSFKRTGAEVDQEIVDKYKNEQWRNIDNSWLDQAGRLALYLDSYTNNSSLALAFELVKSGKVLLFAADAQTGNWLSWFNIEWQGKNKDFTTRLLENTVLYKVGHHASHNATLVQSLEAMGHDELIAMIPVDKTDGNITKKNGWKMPAKNLYKRLKEKTQFRVLRMDDGFADECDPVKNKATAKWDKLKGKPVIDNKNFFVEYTVHE
ncbi:MAG TPA: hypothetical protein VFU29_06575, partial [Chitinophagaceae bacterium]|nr:hypothetical protein [Chitinophagaceae bacterium]